MFQFFEKGNEKDSKELENVLKKYPETLQYQEPKKTVFELYCHFLLHPSSSYKLNITRQIDEVIKDIDKLEITLSPQNIKDIYEKYGVIQLRELNNDTLIVGCGNFIGGHRHSGADTIDPELSYNPTIVGFYGNAKSDTIFKDKMYNFIIDEGPLGILMGGSFESTTYRILSDKGVVFEREGYPICVSSIDHDNNDEFVAGRSLLFPGHIHCYPVPGSPDFQTRNYDDVVKSAKDLTSKDGSVFAPKYVKIDELKENEYTATIIEKLKSLNSPYLIERSGGTITFKTINQELLKDLVCPYSQCEEIFVYSENSTPKIQT